MADVIEEDEDKLFSNFAQRQQKALSKFKNQVSQTPKCSGCAKTVYHAEQVVSLGKSWHRACLQRLANDMKQINK